MMKQRCTIKLENLTTYIRTISDMQSYNTFIPENIYAGFGDIKFAPIDIGKKYDETELEIPSHGIVLKPNMVYKMYGTGKFEDDDIVKYNTSLLQYGLCGNILEITDPNEYGIRSICMLVEAIEHVVVYSNIDIAVIYGNNVPDDEDCATLLSINKEDIEYHGAKGSEDI